MRNLTERTVPSADEVLSYFQALSNRGRWGVNDELGTLNLITPEKRASAVASVTHGTVVPLGTDLDPDDADPLGRGTGISLEPHGHEIGRAFGQRETVSMTTHGSPAHIDSPSHMAWDGHWYNGFSTTERTGSGGVGRSSVAVARGGIVTRGVLLDVASSRGCDWLEDGDGVYPDDLDTAEARQGVAVEPGDLLIVRTGCQRRILSSPEWAHSGFASGYHAACLPWLHDRDVALIASDSLNDINPSGYGGSRPALPEDYSRLPADQASLLFPVHAVALAQMGAWLIDNLAVEELRDTCDQLGRWEFLAVIDPLRLVGATGSPVNPLAIF